MERLRRVASLWSWLPAFRAVAETQHLPTASGQLFVSPSALSRTIRLLEEDLEASLFIRQGRRIELNEAGERFLGAVRDAMRLVHDGIQGIRGVALQGPVYCSSANLITDAVLVPAVTSLREAHPKLQPHIRRTDRGEVVGELLRGRLDVALTTVALKHAQLSKVALGRVSAGVYCGPDHPLYRKRTLDPAAVAEHPFAVWGVAEDGSAADGWPPDLERTVGAVVHTPGLALELAARSKLLAILPDALGSEGTALRRLPLDVVPPTPVFALTRHKIAEGGRAEALVDAATSAVARGLQ